MSETGPGLDPRRRGRRHPRRLAVAGVLCFAAAGAAQSTLVVPPAHAASEAPGSTNVPFGRSVPMRMQVAYDGLCFGGPVLVTGMAFRVDGGAVASAKQVDVEVRMSTLALGATAIQAVFAANPGPDEVVVRDRGSLTLPVAAGPGAPAPFAVGVPLDRSFAYDPAGGALLIEVLVHGQQPGGYPLDATSVCDSPTAAIGPAGCGSGPLRATSATTQVVWGAPLFLQVDSAPAAAPVGVLLGTTETGSFGGLALPIDLAPYGAPRCWLSIDAAVALSGLAGGSGSATFRIAIPSLPWLQGAWVRYQGFSLEPANPLGLATSQAGKIQICGWDPVARVYAPGVATATGAREIGIAPVVELTVQ